MNNNEHMLFDGDVHNKELRKILNDPSITKIDHIDEQFDELYEVKNPSSIKSGKKRDGNTSATDTMWVYYPWRRAIVHILNEADFHSVRVSRNSNLLAGQTQKDFRNTQIGFAGLNVGNPGAVCIALTGGSKHMKFADFDTLSLSNLNRFRAGLCELGQNKAVITKHQVHEIDPFISVLLFEQGLNDTNIEDFLLRPKINLLIEEMDNLPLKVSVRKIAKKNNIPVLMVTGNGSNIIIDIERYDADSSLPILNGYLDEQVEKGIFSRNNTIEQKLHLARDFMGKKYLIQELNESFDLVGTQLAGIPQLSEATFLRGAALSYFARKILTEKDTPSGRFLLNLDDVIQT